MPVTHSLGYREVRGCGGWQSAGVAHGDRIRRIDLERLDRGEFELMLAGALGGEIVPATLSRCGRFPWAALFAREIVMAAHAQGRQGAPGMESGGSTDGCRSSGDWLT